MIEITWNHRTLKIAAELRFQHAMREKLAKSILGRFGFRRYGNSPFMYGKLERLHDVTAACEEAGIHVEVTRTVQKVMRYLRECLREQRDEYRARLQRTAERGLQLRPFQRKDALKMAVADSLINACPMGLGKTVTTLMALPDGVHGWVVCPAVMRLTWLEEITKWRPEIKVTMVKKAAELFFPTEPNHLAVLNYEQLLPCQMEGTRNRKNVVSLDEVLREAAGETCVVVVDEYHSAKSYKAGRTKRIRTAFNRMRKVGGRSYGLTGTPITNNPGDLWCLLQNMDLAADAFGDFARFTQLMGGFQQREFGRMVTHWGGKIHSSVGDLIAPYVISRSKESVWSDMPAKVFQSVVVELDLIEF